MVFVPLSAPSILLVSLARGLLGIAVQMQLGNPLVNDYVAKDSRGKASLYISFGYILGETFAMVVLFRFSRDMDPLKAFAICATIITVIGVFVTCCIREHVAKRSLRKRSNSTSSNRSSAVDMNSVNE